MKTIAVDIETTWDALNKLRVISVCEEGGEPYIAYRYDLHGEDIPQEVIDLIGDSRCLFHNAWFDVGVLAAYGIRPRKVHCTMLAEMFISGGIKATSLRELVYKYESYLMDKTLQKSDWTQPLTDEQIHYCYDDVKYLHNIYVKQITYLKRSGAITHLALKNEVVRLWAPDLYYGYPVDTEVLGEIADKCREEYKKVLDSIVGRVPVKAFLIKGASLKLIKEELYTFCAGIHEVLGNTTRTLKDGTVKLGFDEFSETNEFKEALTLYIMSGNKEIVMDIGSPHFAKRLAEHYGVDSSLSFKESSIVEYVETGVLPLEMQEILVLLLEARKYAKILSVYATLKEDRTYVGSDGLTRLKLGFTYTVSGRIGLTPLSTMPKPDEDDSKLANKLRSAYLPPKGYKTLSFDYKSAEDIVAGVLYNDKMKIKICEEGYDQYLMFASKLFGNFEYTDPSQTKELKSKYKDFRQAVKAILLARNYCAGAARLELMANAALQKAGINKTVSGKYVLDTYAELFEGVSAAQTTTNDNVVSFINGIYDSYNFASPELRLLRMRDFKPLSEPCKLRANVLRDAGKILSVQSVLGLSRPYIPHKEFYGTSYGSRSTKVTSIVNYPIQSSATECTWVAILLIKKRFPFLQIGVSIHDSIVCFCPENEDLEHICKEVQKLMSLAGWVVLQRKLDTDAEVLDRGW